MAIDTKLKRMSAVGSRRLPWFRRFMPSPDSSMDQADRQHLAFVYRGVLAGEPVETVDGPYYSDAFQFYVAGSIREQFYISGSLSDQIYVAGSVIGMQA